MMKANEAFDWKKKEKICELPLITHRICNAKQLFVCYRGQAWGPDNNSFSYFFLICDKGEYHTIYFGFLYFGVRRLLKPKSWLWNSHQQRDGDQLVIHTMSDSNYRDPELMMKTIIIFIYSNQDNFIISRVFTTSLFSNPFALLLAARLPVDCTDVLLIYSQGSRQLK